MKIGIFPGSFNPIHIGHLAIANYIAEYEGFDEIWFLITPQNPIKGKITMLSQELRLELLEKSIEDYPKFKTCTIEWTLPKPTYTITTLQKLKVLYIQHTFEMIVGSDNWEIFHRWKDYQRILNNFKLVVYPRRGSHKIPVNHPNVRMCKAPMIEISSSFIRRNIAEGKDIRFFLPFGVYDLIKTDCFSDINMIGSTSLS